MGRDTVVNDCAEGVPDWREKGRHQCENCQDGGRALTGGSMLISGTVELEYPRFLLNSQFNGDFDFPSGPGVRDRPACACLSLSRALSRSSDEDVDTVEGCTGTPKGLLGGPPEDLDEGFCMIKTSVSRRNQIVDIYMEGTDGMGVSWICVHLSDLSPAAVPVVRPCSCAEVATVQD